MLVKIAHCWKPGVTSTTHLLAAAMLWSFIGVYLLLRGYFLYNGMPVWLALPALLAGALKARYLLDRAAGKNIARILALKENSCLGAVYSLRLWSLILLMMVAGRVLRWSGVPDQWVALTYLAVGFALLLSSRLYWRQWLVLNR